MLHESYHAYLEGLVTRHGELQSREPDDEIRFLEDARANLAKLIDHANLYKTLKAASDDLGLVLEDPARSSAQEPRAPTAGTKAQPRKNADSPGPPVPSPEIRAAYPDPVPLEYTDDELRSMARSDVGKWTEEKKATAKQNPHVHPDSILPNGSISSAPWAWWEVKLAIDKYVKDGVPGIATALPHRTPNSVKHRLHTFGRGAYRAPAQAPGEPREGAPDPDTQESGDGHAGAPVRAEEAPDAMPDMAAESPDPAPEQEPEQDAAPVPEPEQAMPDAAPEPDPDPVPAAPPDPFEDMLPLSMSKPSLSARLRIFRIAAGMSAIDAAEATGLQKIDLYDVENGKRAPSDAELASIAAAYGIDAHRLAGMPMGEAMPFGNCATAEERLKLARVRSGLSVEMLAGRTGDSAYSITRYEQSIPNMDVAERMANAMRIPVEAITGGVPLAPAPKKPPTTRVLSCGDPVGTKIRDARTAAGMTPQELAAKAGCSSAHIYNIENQRVCPSDAMIQKIASAIGVPVDDLHGARIRQPDAARQPKPAQKGSTGAPAPAKAPDAAPKPRPAARAAAPAQIRKAPNALCQRISDARRAKGLSQNDLASRAKCPLPAIQELESIGRTESNGYILRRVADVLEISEFRA